MKLSALERMPLRAATDRAWVALAVARFDEVLVDHAHCEKKAAANALSMMTAYPEIPGLPAAMARLAREEAGHLAQVLALMKERGLALGRDLGDPYVHRLLDHVSKAGELRRVDRLFVAALIEARSEDRLALLAQHLPDPELRKFYAGLAECEAGHATLFLRLADKLLPEAELEARLDFWLDAEAAIIRALPLRAAVH